VDGAPPVPGVHERAAPRERRFRPRVRRHVDRRLRYDLTPAWVLARPGPAQAENRITGVVAARSFRGSRTRLALQPHTGPPLEFELDGPAPPEGQPITLALRPEAISIIPG